MVDNKKVDPVKDVQRVAKSIGVEAPDLVAKGDLSVSSKKETIVLKDKETLTMEDAKKKKEAKPFNKKDIPLPVVGKVFMCEGHEYKVTYINEGKHRFTCEPHKGNY